MAKTKVQGWMKSIKPSVKLAFAAAFSTLLVSLLLALLGTQRLYEAKDRVTHTRIVRDHIHQIREALHRAEADQRGYLITGRDDFLAERESTLEKLPRTIDNLASLTTDNPDQQRLVLQLKEQAQARIDSLRKVAALRTEQGQEAAFSAVASGEGIRQMADARQTLQEMQTIEEHLLDQRARSWEAGLRNLLLALGAAGILTLVLFAWLLYLLRGEVRQRTQREAEHLEARQHLEEKVAARTEELQAEIGARSSMVSTLETRNQQMTLLKAMGDQLQACFTIEEAAGAISHYSERLFPGWAGRISILSASRNLLESAVSWGKLNVGPELFRPDECWALRRGRMHHVEPHSQGLACPHLDHPEEGHSLCIPLAAQGDTLGVLHLQRSTNGQVSEEELDFAATVGEHVALVLANLRLRQVLQAQSVRDALTGLFNRRYMEESLERELRRAVRNGKPITVLMLDLDHFKRLNDTYGHDAGDAVLRSLGEVFKGAVRGEDIVCRYGGEEFTIIMPDAAEEHAVQRAEQIIKTLSSTSLVHNGASLGPFSISIGVASCPRGQCDGNALIRAADKALYQAKANGRGRVEVGTTESAAV